ncbi:MAG: sugar transferase [Candidatus Zixiibacteriota bacterium]|jgi:lipopolysaccharide/colanic/teichoic acid biosynthesis glycosyltransferase
MAESVVIVGAGDRARHLARTLEESPAASLSFCDFAGDEVALSRRLGELENGLAVIAETSTKDKALQAVAGAWDAGAPALVAAPLLPALAPVGDKVMVEGEEYYRFPAGGPGPWRRFTKWLMDKLVAAAFIIILTPIWLPMFVAIKLDSRGPIVFRQKRVTRGRREFNIYKFRTMFATVPKYQASPGEGTDIRITRAGRILRKLGLDETAQLINVIKGQMSLVGPRPEMALSAAEYEPWQNYRLEVKPGITGLWQIAGSADRPIKDALEFDFYYLANQTLAMDIRIFLKTIPILFGKGGGH